MHPKTDFVDGTGPKIRLSLAIFRNSQERNRKFLPLVHSKKETLAVCFFLYFFSILYYEQSRFITHSQSLSPANAEIGKRDGLSSK